MTIRLKPDVTFGSPTTEDRDEQTWVPEGADDSVQDYPASGDLDDGAYGYGDTPHGEYPEASPYLRAVQEQEGYPVGLPAAPTHVQFGQRVCEVPLPAGLGTYDEIMDELLGYVEVLKGLADAPVESPYLQLMEVATAYLVRGYEIEMLIHQGEHTGSIERGSSLMKLRTGPLESFINSCRRMADLGSRRLSQETVLTEQRRTEGERW